MDDISVPTIDTFAKSAFLVFFLLLVADWWARNRNWDFRTRLFQIAHELHSLKLPLRQQRERFQVRAAARQAKRSHALARMGQAAKARHDVQLHRHFTIGPPQIILAYAGQRLKVRLYNETIWKLNVRYKVKLLALEPDDQVGWRFSVYSPETGRVAQLAWLVTAA